jgi:hypothetical protein
MIKALMERVKSFYGLHRTVVIFVGVILVAASITWGGESLVNYLAERRYDKERAVAAQQIESLNKQVAAEQQITALHDRNAAALQAELIAERAERVRLMQDLANIAKQRSAESARDKAARDDVNKVWNDYDALRKLDCVRSKQLGFPCPEEIK